MIKSLKQLYRNAQQAKRAKARTKARFDRCEKEVQKTHRAYLSKSEMLVARVEETIEEAKHRGISDMVSTVIIEDIKTYIQHAERQINQIERRVFKGETIPHEEKVFSLFEPHTEWISKGKAGVPQELGLKVCIIEDQRGFILNHRIMQQEQDVDVAVPFLKDTKALYPNLTKCSFDKGFYSPTNKKELGEILDTVILPKKGKLNAEQKAEESTEEFVTARNKHSGVESAIHALGNHGLDRCPDHGIHGFKRYVALAIVARNIQIMGSIIIKKEREQQQAQEKRKLPQKKAA